MVTKEKRVNGMYQSLSHEDFRLRYTALWFQSVNELDQALHCIPLI